jgi:uncharacterized protein (DUF488 family)
MKKLKSVNFRIYTIGYGNRKWQDFLELLNKNKIKLLVDIRSNPFSRFNPIFRRVNLIQELKIHDIEYLFMGDKLGGKPIGNHLYSDNKLDLKSLELHQPYQKGIVSLMELAKSKKNLCIMCAEMKPETCHRKSTVGQSLIKKGIQVIHIDNKGQLQIEPHEG